MTYTSCTCKQSPDDLLTVSDAASVANVSEKTIRRRIRSRELPYHRVGKRVVRIRRRDLNEWLEDGFEPALSTGEML